MAGDILVLCNGANASARQRKQAAQVIKLDYRSTKGERPTARISIPKFTDALLHLPPRLLDLLEIASYVFTADRSVPRGARDQVQFSGWSRKFKIRVTVSDSCFWNRPDVKAKLEELLTFISGDETYSFHFDPGFQRQPTNLFDRADYADLIEVEHADVALFSGGLDSTTGAVELLELGSRPICLVSHKSGLNSTTRTQKQLVEALGRIYPGRIRHVPFECNMTGITRAPEETQRTRFFLYGSIALAVARACNSDRFLVFENGITSINFRKRQDLVNARASRTTHPKTIRLMQELFELILESAFKIENPYIWRTKADLLEKLAASKGKTLFSSTVSCSRSIKRQGPTHCGTCSQCVDRRFAAYGANLGELDDVGTYGFDFVSQPLTEESAEARTIINDYLAMAGEFKKSSEDHFREGDRLTELSEAYEGMPESEEMAFVEAVHHLCSRFGHQVWAGYEAMRSQYGDPSNPKDPDSLYAMVERGEPHVEPAKLLAENLLATLNNGIRLAYQRKKPANEHELNDQIEALLASARTKAEREFPNIPFATKQSTPDHSTEHCEVIIESKYVRKSRTVKAISDEMASDLVTYGKKSLILFLVYDPDGLIRKDSAFRTDFESKGRCSVGIVR